MPKDDFGKLRQELETKIAIAEESAQAIEDGVQRLREELGLRDLAQVGQKKICYRLKQVAADLLADAKRIQWQIGRAKQLLADADAMENPSMELLAAVRHTLSCGL